MINLIDIIVIAIIALAGFIGYKMGFAKSIISLVSFFVAVGIALIFYKPLAVILTEKTSIDDWIVEKVMNTRVNESGDLVSQEELEEKQEELPSETKEEKEITVKGLLEELPSTVASSIDVVAIKDNAKQELAQKLSELIMKLLSLIIIFVVIKLTLLIATFIVDGVMKLPVLKQINEILGMAFGLLVGFAEMYVAFAIITFISSVADINFVIDAIKSSAFASIIFENNLIIKLLS